MCVMLFIARHQSHSCHLLKNALVTSAILHRPSPSPAPSDSAGSLVPMVFGVREEWEERRRLHTPNSIAITLPHSSSSPLPLNRLKHKHNWTCWKPHNGTEGKVKSYSRNAWVPRSGGNQQHPWLLCLNTPEKRTECRIERGKN